MRSGKHEEEITTFFTWWKTKVNQINAFWIIKEEKKSGQSPSCFGHIDLSVLFTFDQTKAKKREKSEKKRCLLSLNIQSTCFSHEDTTDPLKLTEMSDSKWCTCNGINEKMCTKKNVDFGAFKIAKTPTSRIRICCKRNRTHLLICWPNLWQKTVILNLGCKFTLSCMTWQFLQKRFDHASLG